MADDKLTTDTPSAERDTMSAVADYQDTHHFSIAPVMMAVVVLLGIALIGNLLLHGGHHGAMISPGNGETVLATSGSGVPDNSLYDLADDYDSLVRGDNVFVVADSDATLSFLESGTGVLMLGYPECPWCSEYIPRVDALAKENGIDRVVYYDVRKARLEEPESYARLLELLGGEEGIPEKNEDGELRVFVPLLLMLDHGKITYSNDDTAHITPDDGISPEEYWSGDADSKFRAAVSGEMAATAEAIERCGDCDD